MSTSKLFLVVQNNILPKTMGPCIEGVECDWIPENEVFAQRLQWRQRMKFMALVSLKDGEEETLLKAIERIEVAILRLNNFFETGDIIEIIVFLQISKLKSTPKNNNANIIFVSDEFFNDFSFTEVLKTISGDVLSVSDLKKFYKSWKDVRKSEHSQKSFNFSKVKNASLRALKLFFIGLSFAVANVAILQARSMVYDLPIHTTESMVSDEQTEYLKNIVAVQFVEIEDLKDKLKKGQCESSICQYAADLDENQKRLFAAMMRNIKVELLTQIYMELLDVEKYARKQHILKNKQKINEGVNKIIRLLREN